ncbi:MAG: Ada metal-binding domain-containing protein [Pseudomonadota bacterium]
MASSPAALPDIEVCQRARLSRDGRFDGRFYIAVLTTGIFCRTTCPARMPAEENVRYYATIAAAQRAGYRPCKRCRPETSPTLPEWTLADDMVLRGVRLIDAGYLNDHSVAELAAELGVGARQLSRLFAQNLGATPSAMARISRVRLAKQLLFNSNMPQAEVAFHAGYGSVSRFNSDIRALFRAPPGALRAKKTIAPSPSVTLHLPVRPPYDHDWVFSYLQRRQLPGVEEVSGAPGSWLYSRFLPDGVVRVSADAPGLRVELPLVEEPIHSLLSRVRRVFDLGADGAVLHDTLALDQTLKPWVDARPGLRVPGAWHGFETAVRAILGQQVSVERGTVLAQQMIERYGAGAFPGPAQLVDKEVAELGMPGRRGRAISLLARLYQAGELHLDECGDYASVYAALVALEGVGPWTANYIRMRVLKDPDAFPDNDWVVLKQLGCTAAQARQRSVAWQPWRAYALMYIWYAAGQARAQGAPD